MCAQVLQRGQFGERRQQRPGDGVAEQVPATRQSRCARARHAHPCARMRSHSDRASAGGRACAHSLVSAVNAESDVGSAPEMALPPKYLRRHDTAECEFARNECVCELVQRTARARSGGLMRTSLAVHSMRRATRAASRRCGYRPSPCDAVTHGTRAQRHTCAHALVARAPAGGRAHKVLSAVNAKSDTGSVPEMRFSRNILRRAKFR